MLALVLCLGPSSVLDAEHRASKSHQELFEICSLEEAHLLSQHDTEALAEGVDTKVWVISLPAAYFRKSNYSSTGTLQNKKGFDSFYFLNVAVYTLFIHLIACG